MIFFDYLIEYNRYYNIFGIFIILCIAWVFSQKKNAINYRLLFTALGMQFLIALVILKTSLGYAVVNACAQGVCKLYTFADQGSCFIFGSLTDTCQPWGFIFAFKVLPIIIFFGALMSCLFYFGIVQYFIRVVNIVFQPLLRTSGAETLCAIANSFLGQTEAPLLVRHYLSTMTKSEFLVVMISGMSTISGAILVVYASLGVPPQHLLASSMMSIPGSLLIAKLLYPEMEIPQTSHNVQIIHDEKSKNIFDAIATGTIDGLHLALNVGAMLISFLGLLALINAMLGWISTSIGFGSLSLEQLFGYVLAPLGYLFGFSSPEAQAAGQLIGMKVAVNELIAYRNLVCMGLSERTINILTYALCGFSNFSCIGIQLGGIGALVPSKREWLSELGLYAVLGGALTNLLSAFIAGLLL